MIRPILFSAEMIRAILAGRKTMTRRVIRPALQDLIRFRDCDDAKDAVVSFSADGHSGPGWYVHCSEYPEDGAAFLGRCPYGEPGDHLWVRETWRTEELTEALDKKRPAGVDGIRFRADDAFVPIANTQDAADAWVQVHERDGKWRPSIFLPRWASRITLEVTAVRVERLQDITEEDALAEGIDTTREVDGMTVYRDCALNPTERGRPDLTEWFGSARDSYRTLWSEINEKRAPWASNCFVWVVSFRRVEQAKAVAHAG